MTEFWCTAAYKGVRCQMSQTRDSGNCGMKVSLTRLIKIIIVYRFYFKKNVVQNMMLMWSQLDAQLRMNL